VLLKAVKVKKSKERLRNHHSQGDHGTWMNPGKEKE
jgi:hypothetical protein